MNPCFFAGVDPSKGTRFPLGAGSPFSCPRFPLAAVSKKQTCVSHSSTESEIVAAEFTVRTEGLQALTFWEHVVHLFVKEQRAAPSASATTPDRGESAELSG